jgi:P-type Cu2+ transporter
MVKTNIASTLIAEPTIPATTTIVLDVAGMKCAGCVSAVEKQLIAQPGVTSACVNLLTGVAAIVTVANQTTTATDLAAKLTSAGFPAEPRTNTSRKSSVDRQKKYAQESSRLIQQLITAGVLLGLSAIGHFTQPTTHLEHSHSVLNNFWWHWGLATLAMIFPGRSILRDGWRSLVSGNPNMNTLVGLGTISAYTASVVALLLPALGWECFFEEPVMIIGFILLGRTLEQQAKHRAANAFDRLLSLQPAIARLVSPDPDRPQAIEIPVEQVKVGEYLRILPGEKIPADGAIRWGQTTIDESLLTGESMPVLKQLGDLAIAGTVNQSGAISIEVTRTGDDTTLAQIITLVEAAQTRKAPVQKLADTVAGYFTYGVLSIAILTCLFWYFIGIHNLDLDPVVSTLTPLKAAIAVLVVACPCALGLATPTAILVGTGIGAERGLLIKGGDVLEAVSQLDTVVFDKTGTLTEGKPQVTDILTADGMTEDELLRLAAAAESATNHPLGTAIQQAAVRLGLVLPGVVSSLTEAGFGVGAELKPTPPYGHPSVGVASARAEEGNLPTPPYRAPLRGGDLATSSNRDPRSTIHDPRSTTPYPLSPIPYSLIVGNQRWLTTQGIDIDAEWQIKAENLAAQGKTLVYVAVNGVMMGLIGVTDQLRADAIETVKQLQDRGLRIVLLTGDRLPVAEQIAKQLGITDIYAEVLPQAKAKTIESLQTNPRSPESPYKVAMIGDGINDAPALAQADLGIAMNAGTDVAIEVADIILMRDRLVDVVSAIELSQATLTKIRQNLFWAVIYNSIGIPAAAGLLYWNNWGAMLSPAAAGAMMALSSVSVVTNSLLLRWEMRRSSSS